MAANECPSCGAPAEPGRRFCSCCGARLGVPRVARPEPEVVIEEEELSAPMRALIWFLELLPGFVSPLVIVMSIVATVAGAMIAVLGIGVFAMGAVFAGFAIGAFGLICYWSAIVWMLCGYLCLPQDGLAEFDGTKWTIFGVLAMAPIGIFYALIGLGEVEV